MRYEEVEKAKAEFNEAKRKFDEIQNAYLVSRGYRELINYDEGTVKWASPASRDGYVWRGSRAEALTYARDEESYAKERAEKQIAKLKAEHGIEETK